MSPDPEARAEEIETEQEVDLGRFWRAILSRWWLPLIGLVLGAIIGLLVSIGGGKDWKTTSEVYLGQPLTPDSSSPVSSISTSLGLATYLATAERTIRSAAAKAGLKPGQLSGNVSSKPILGITGSKLGTAAPIVAITVTGSSRFKTQAAADAIANVLVDKFAPYTNAKLKTLGAQLLRDNRQLRQVGERLASATAAQRDLLTGSIGTTEKLVALTGLNSTIQAAIAQQLALQTDRTGRQQQIAAITNVEAPNVFSRGLATRSGGPSRRSGVVIGAIIGLLLGLIAAIIWDPVAGQVRQHAA